MIPKWPAADRIPIISRYLLWIHRVKCKQWQNEQNPWLSRRWSVTDVTRGRIHYAEWCGQCVHVRAIFVWISDSIFLKISATWRGNRISFCHLILRWRLLTFADVVDIIFVCWSQPWPLRLGIVHVLCRRKNSPRSKWVSICPHFKCIFCDYLRFIRWIYKRWVFIHIRSYAGHFSTITTHVRCVVMELEDKT